MKDQRKMMFVSQVSEMWESNGDVYYGVNLDGEEVILVYDIFEVLRNMTAQQKEFLVEKAHKVIDKI